MNDFLMKLQTIQQKSGLSKKDFGKKIGVKGYGVKWLGQFMWKGPSPKLVKQIAAALGVAPESLL